MRADSQMLLREIAGEHILVPAGDMINRFQGIMALNGSGLLLWQRLQKDCTREELVEALCEVYDVDEATAASDVREFLIQLDEAGILIR